MSNLIPGYLTIPTEREATFDTYMSTRGFKPLRPNQMSYWQNYKKFFVSFQKAMWGDGRDGGEQLRLRLSAQARRAGLRRAARLRADARRQDERVLLPGLQSAAVVPEPEEDHRGALQAEVPRRHGSAADRDGAVLGEPRRAQRRRPGEDPDRGDRAADHLLCRGRRLADQFRPLAAVALGRRHAAGRGQARHLDHGADLSAPEGAVPEGGRPGSRADPQSRLALQGPERADAGGARQGAQRLRARRRRRSERSDQDRAAEGQAGRQLRRAARRRHDRVRLLDLFRLLHRGGQQDGPPRHQRSGRHRRLLQMGVVVAGQPPHPVQPRLGRHERQAVGSEPQAARVERHASGPATTCRTSRRPPSRTWSAPSS